MENRRILFYDGDCGLCQRSVNFLIARDRRRRLHFAPLQGETAADLVPEELRRELSTLVYHRGDGSISLRSTGALRALADTGGRWSLPAKAALCLPASLRDAVYRWIARNRSRISHPSCRLPTPEERMQLLP